MALSSAIVLSTGLHLPNSARADSLWTEETARPLFSDKRATAVGDILTILIQENNSTSKDNSTKTSRKTGVDASLSSFLYSPGASSLLTKNGKMPALKFDSKNEFSGGGAINNTEKITARIAVRVVDVLPNRNLIIEGTRRSSFSGETQDIVLRGTIRPEDITPNNTVYSYNIADAQIRFVAKGSLSDSQRKGWFTRVWDKITPF